MNTQYDAALVHQFLCNTPEKALRQMLVGPQFTEPCFNLLMKISRCAEDDFCEHFYNETFPKFNLTAKEIAIKESFWPNCIKVLDQHGLLSPAQKAVA